MTAIDELINDRFEVERVLVIAPLRVAATVWAEEAAKWDHLRHLRVSKVLGPREQRIQALHQPAELYVINRENVDWLVTYVEGLEAENRREGTLRARSGTSREQKCAGSAAGCAKLGRWPFDMVVLDELSSFKDASSGRFRALRRHRAHMERVVGLTGTPAPNGLIDLWPQVFLLDRGQRLEKTLGGYRRRYFNEGQRSASVVFTWVPKPEAPAAIYGKLSDLCVSMRAQDYLTLPPRMDRMVEVELSTKARKAYETLEREAILPLRDGVVTAQTAAVATGKLLQLAGGAVYDENRRVHVIHDEKLDALADLVEAANGQPVLIYYAYQHDMERIKARIPKARVMQTNRDVADWNAGEASVMLAHPDSAGHGLNLQSGGHIVIWFGLTWSLEKYQQANARLHRQGQLQPVTVYHLIARGTIDEDVIKVLTGKADRQNALIDAVKARIYASEEAL